MSETLDKLAAVLEERKRASPESSYVAGLYAAGMEAVDVRGIPGVLPSPLAS